MALGVLIALDDLFLGDFLEAVSVSMPFRYLIGCPLGSWIIRKAIAPSVEVAGNILTGTRTSERRRLPDQTGIGAMGIHWERYRLSRIWAGLHPLQVNKSRLGKIGKICSPTRHLDSTSSEGARSLDRKGLP